MLLRQAALTLIACLVAHVAVAQEAPALSPDISAVATGGYWSVGGSDGQYRVIITTGGFEEITSQPFLQWITRPGPDDIPATIDSSVAIIGAGGGNFHLYNPRFVLRNRRWLLLIDGVNIHTPSGKHEEWVITLGLPGAYTVRQTPHPDWPEVE